MKPFLKWAGGKRWLSRRFTNLSDLHFDRYIEPFLGGGAIFFELCPKIARISDSNRRLICTYEALRSDANGVAARLQKHHLNHDRCYYYKIRKQQFDNPLDLAAQFIYLNRTCWNGLYRENLSGQFNVPKGTKSQVLYPDDDFASVGAILSGVEIEWCDFEKTIGCAGSGDFIFADPPYTVKHNNNGFIKYNETIFSWNDQIRLRNAIREATSRGARAIVTNAYHPSVCDLYAGLGKVVPLERHSILSNDKRFRSPTQEAVIFVGINPDEILVPKKFRNLDQLVLEPAVIAI